MRAFNRRWGKIPGLAIYFTILWLLVWTGAGTWKAKRIRRDPHVLVAASTMRGRERGQRLEGSARIVDGIDVKALIRKKYGWQMRLLERFSRGGDSSVTIEIADR